MESQIHSKFILTFDGKDNDVNVGRKDLGGALDVGSSAFTISGWVKPHRLDKTASNHGIRNIFFAFSLLMPPTLVMITVNWEFVQKAAY